MAMHRSRQAHRHERWFFRHQGTLIGIAAALLLQVGASGYGDTPDTRDSNAEIAGWFVANRGSVLVGAVLSIWALMALLAVMTRAIATTRATATTQGTPTTRTTAMPAAGVGVGVLVIGMHLPLAGIAYVIAERDPQVAAALFELTLATAPVAAAPLSVAMLSIAWHAWGRRRSLAVTSAAAALMLAAASTAWAYSGPLSPDVAQQVLYGVLSLWLMTSGIGERKRSSTRLPAPSASRGTELLDDVAQGQG